MRVEVTKSTGGHPAIKRDAPPFYEEARRQGKKGSYQPYRHIREFKSDHNPNLAVVVASGSSLSSFQFSQLKRSWITTFAINEEAFRNREHYIPDWWIFYDTNVLDRHRGGASSPCALCGETGELDSKTRVLTRTSLFQHAISQAQWPHKPIPDWLGRVVGYETSNPYKPGSEYLYLKKTTATAAISAAVMMGHKHIALLGVDCYTRPDAYYYTGHGPKKKMRRGMTPLGNGRYSEDRHIRMMTDFTHVAKALERVGWPGTIYQCSTLSPMSCFEKVRWEEACRRYGR